MIKENLTRIIGVILIVAGVIALKYVERFSIVFFIPGIIMLVSSKKIAQKELKEFLIIFKSVPEKRFFLIALFDAFSWFGLFFFTYLLGNMLKKQLVFLVPSPELLLKVMVMVFAYFLALIIVSIIIYSVFKGLIWLTILNHKASWSFFKKFSLLNLLWIIIWLVPFALLAALKQELIAYGIGLVIIAYVHFTTLTHYYFIKSNKIFASIKKAFSTKIKRFLLPYSYLAVVYFILLQVFWVVPRQMNYITFVSVIMLVFFMAFYRLYISRLLQKLA